MYSVLIVFTVLFSTVICSAQFSLISGLQDCEILSRHASADGNLVKYFQCKGTVVSLAGRWKITKGKDGVLVRWEFGSYFDGPTKDFGVTPSKADSKFTDCRYDNSGSSNAGGYLTETVGLNCEEGNIQLNGQWTEEIQGHWSYNLRLGEVTSQPQWIDDVASYTANKYQRWCPTKFGKRLCGSVDVPKVDHGIPPDFKRDLKPV